MTHLIRKVAIRYLTRIQTDSVSDVVFTISPQGTNFSIRANHPRLGNIGYLHVDKIDLEAETDEDAISDVEFGTSFLASRNHLNQWRRKLGEPTLGVWGVTHSWTDRRFRAEGVGVRLYLIALSKLSKIPAVLVPNSVFGGSGATSPDARRVWDSMKKFLPHFGDLVWGGSLNYQQLLNSPLKPRRSHGFGRVKVYAPSADED